jgi:hypothetical protein
MMIEESLHDRLSRVSRKRTVEEEAGSVERHNEASKKQLLKNVRKKLTTSSIGALAKFEAHFGQVWGHGLPDSKCSEVQLAWREIWERCRTDILNLAGSQTRAVDAEFQQYVISWNRFTNKF